MKSLFVVLVLGGCGGSKPAPSGPGPSEPPGRVEDTRSELEKRRDTGCDQLRPKLVECAVADARVELEAGRMSKKDFDANTSPEIQAKLGSEWLKACRVPMSSRQVRVLEVCFHEEPTCGPLLACLEHLNQAGTK